MLDDHCRWASANLILLQQPTFSAMDTLMLPPLPILPHIGPDCTFQSSRHTQDIQCKVWIEWLNLKNVIYFICDQIQQVESES